MNTKLKIVAAALLALAAGMTQKAEAANPARLNIDVAITANLSVSVNGVQSSTDTSITWNTATSNQKFIGSTATVTNDSGGQTEKWALSSNANSINTNVAGSGSWALAASTDAVGADQFGLQAVFGSSATAGGSCPAIGSTDWNQAFASPITAAPVTYTSTKFADSSLNNGGNGSLLLYNPDVATGGGDGRMLAGRSRALCWRIITPLTSSTIDTQNVQVIITAQNP